MQHKYPSLAYSLHVMYNQHYLALSRMSSPQIHSFGQPIRQTPQVSFLFSTTKYC